MCDKKVLVLLAEGSEEIEAVTPINVLRRAKVNVTVAGVAGAGPVSCRCQTVILPDMSLAEALMHGPYDAIVLPGGLTGAENFSASDEVTKLLTEQEKSGRIIAAICASPALVLVAHEIFKGKRITSYPSFKEKVESTGKYNYVEDRVVSDGQLITSRGPGTAMEFALAIVEKLLGAQAAAEMLQPLLVK